MRTNIIPTVLILTGVISIILFYIAITPTEDELRQNLLQFYDIINKDITEVCIVVDETGNDYLFYIVIKNKKIIKEMERCIVNKTYIPDNPNTQFGVVNHMSIKLSNQVYTFEILSSPYGRSLEENAVDIVLFKKPAFDITKDYVFSEVDRSKYRDYTSYYHDRTDYQYRNDELHRFIQKYISKWISNMKATQEGVFLDYRKKSTGISFEGIQN